MGFAPVHAHGVASHVDVTRELFIPALDDTDPNATFTQAGGFQVIQLAAIPLADAYIFFTFKVPDDFVSFKSVKLVWEASPATANMYWGLASYYGAAGEHYATRHSLPWPLALGTTSTGGLHIINVQEPANPLILPSIAKGDYMGVWLERDSTSPLDTINAAVNVIGLLFTYTAEQ